MLDARRTVGFIALVGIIGWFLFLPLRDIFTFPDRISVLPNLETDARAYDAFARDLAQSWHIAALPSKHPPGWMVVLASVYATLGHSYVAGKMLSWLALVVTVPLCAWMAHRAFGPTAAIIAALLCASSPGLRGYVGTLQYEVMTAALFTLFLVLSIATTEATTPRDVVRRATIAGLVGAALVLTRETFVPVVPITAAWIWSQLRMPPPAPRPTRPQNAVLAACVLIAVAAAPAIVWSAAQTTHHQRLILISEKGPKEFQLGNNPLANGTYNEPLVGMAEPAGIPFIRQFPRESLRLAVRKVLYCFGVLRDGWNVPHPVEVWIWRVTTGALPLALITPVVGGGWVLALCIIALLTLGKSGRRRWWVLHATVATILAVHVITIGSYRFFIPLLPVLYVIASGPLARSMCAVLPALRSPVARAAVLVMLIGAVAAQYQRWPLRVTYRAADLDGIAAANAIDEESGSLVRIADAERGERPVALLADTYVPEGSLRVTVRIRRVSIAAIDADPVARVTLTQLDGRTACVNDVPGLQLPANEFVDIALLCVVSRDGPATLAVFNLGRVDLSIDSIQLAWRN